MNNANLRIPPPLFTLSGIVLLGFALRLFAFTGIFGADDVAVAHVAMNFLENGFSVPEGHYAQRLGLILPLALIFKLFGTGDWQFAALPMAASTGAIVLAYSTARLIVSTRAGLLAALLMAVFPLDIANASMLFPDTVLGTCLALAFYLILRAENAKRPWLPSLAAGLLIGLGWLIKVEAPILIPVLGVYWLLDPPGRWRNVLIACAGALAVLVAEGLTYLVLSGDFLRGIHAALNQGGGIAKEEYSATQLWIYPKAWFITTYEFGLHYYLLFAAMAWVVIGRREKHYVLLAWLVLVLLWLEFGGNPFAEHYQVKSHLSRYCLTIAVPSVVLIAALLEHLLSQKLDRVATILAGGATGLGLLLVVFNTLALDGIRATKLGLDYATDQQTFPLYLDKKSYDMAGWYLGDQVNPADLRPMQQHDFTTQATSRLHADEIHGWALDNRVFADYAFNRYGILPMADILDNGPFSIAKTIDNPGSRLAYVQAGLMRNILSFMPSSYLTNKARATLDNLLKGDEVRIYRANSLPSPMERKEAKP